MNLALIFAIASPLLFGIMNILDKYVVSHRVKKPMGFAVIVTLFTMIVGIIIALFVNWNGIDFNWLIFPLIVGVIGGINIFLYYTVMQKEDASHMVGLSYLYPIIVVLLSFFILNERLSWSGYLGLFLVLMGVVMISIRLKQIKLKAGLLMIVFLIILMAVWEFLIKIATINLSIWQAFAIVSIVNGVTASFFLLSPKIRSDFFSEIKNFKWSFLTETFTILGAITLYFAMSRLPATVVSSIAAIQPMAVLVYERIADKLIGKMQRDHLLLPKLGSIFLIVIGIILLSFASGG
jgi:drug/metabolite transporter (DMT)-like permease